MSHSSLYRTYRPQTFDDVVGQSHITRTLRNAVAEGAVAHAYLFAGPRGTGKTTTARILAKALECEKGPTPDPDGTCEQCVEIAEGRHPDVYELDAASRTGVDNVREEIIGRVSLAPAMGRWKVYIVDEVHMLSTAAFNALLKTLEEPPSHVLFVLCTTHPRKVPETIQSRCQRFDFRRISVDDIAGRLRRIADSEQIAVPDAALSLMARHAAGGMRDAITTLEQLAAFGGDSISLEDVEGLLGEVGWDQLFECAALVLRRDIAGLFYWVADLSESGTDLAEFVRALTSHVRDLYIAASVEDAASVLDRPEADLPRLETQAREFGTARLGRMLDLLGELGSEMRWSSDPRLSLEVALTRMASPQGDLTLEALDERLEELESASRAPVHGEGLVPAQSRDKGGEAPTSPTTVQAEPSCRAETPAGQRSAASGEPPPTVIEVVHEPATKLDRASMRRAWPAVLADIRKARPTRGHMFAAVDVDVDRDGVTLVLEFPEGQEFQMDLAADDENRAMLRTALANVLGTAPPFRYQLGRGEVRPSTDRATPADTGDQPDTERTPSAAGASASQPGGEAVPVGPGREEPDDAPVDDVEKLLVEQFGARVVAEETHHPDGEDES
jgi:DNA polymerase-3 subunit gamma/tau